MSDVTLILSKIGQGESAATEQLLPLIYDELRNLAAAKLAQEKPGQTLQPTALVHEVYLRLVGSEPDKRWRGRTHFLSAAAEAMRRLLIEAARRKQTLKRGGGERRVELEAAEPMVLDETLDLLALDEALHKFAQQQPLKAELVKLRFFAGLTIQQAADVLGVSLATAERHGTFARTWLFAQVQGEEAAAEKSFEK
jgi:RNA polymerase sigma factor (TIGR02999 family)